MTFCHAMSNGLRSTVLFVAAAGLFGQQKPVFTEDFESGKIDPAAWDQRVSGTATLAVEATSGAHGKYALRVHYPDGATRSYAFAIATHLPDSVRTHLFGRAYMKITGNIGTTHNPMMFAGEPGWQMSKFNEIGTIRGNWEASYQENKSPRDQGRGEIIYRSEVPPMVDKWFLLEWEFNDDPSSTTVWIDGEKLTTSTGGGTKGDVAKFEWPKASGKMSGLVGGFKEFGFGARVFVEPPKEFDIYYDDIAIGTSRIGPAK